MAIETTKRKLASANSCLASTSPASIRLAMLISSSIPVMAFSVTNGNKTFDKKWELSTTSDDGKGVLTYGYNTLAINEDYAHAYHSTKDHYAYVKNGNGSFSGSNVGKGNWSKIEVAHKGNSITYGNSY